MAESDGSRSRRSGGRSSSKSKKSSSGSSNRRSSGSRSNDRRPLREIAAEAVNQAQELIGRPVESVTGMERDGNEWVVTMEVLELERVPSTTDVLGRYEVTVDKDGEMTGARRTRRYPRAEARED